MRKLLGVLTPIVIIALALVATPASAQSGARITLLHGIPGTPVDVEVGGADVFTGFDFGQTQDLSSFSGQTLAGLTVKLAGTDTVAIDAGDVTLPSSGNHTVVAHLAADGTPTLSVFANDTSAIAAGQGRVTVRHTAEAPAVDVRAAGTVAFANLVNPNEAKADLPVGTVPVDVVAAGTGGPAVLGPIDLAVENGVSTIVYAVGSLGGGTLQVLTQTIGGLGTAPSPGPAAGSATIMLLHGIPGTPVDVEVDNAVVLPGFQFGQMQDLSALSGQTLTGLRVKLAGTDTVAIDAGDLTLPASGNFTAVAHLSAAGVPTLTVFQNDVSRTAAGQGRLTVRHVAEAPAVDVRAGGSVVFPNVANPNEAKADLPVGTVSADVVAAGTGGPAVIGPLDVSIRDGESLIVYAVGSLDDASLQVLTQTIGGIGTAPTRVDTGNSPVEEQGNGLSLIIMAAVLAAMTAGGGALAVRRVRS